MIHYRVRDDGPGTIASECSTLHSANQFEVVRPQKEAIMISDRKNSTMKMLYTPTRPQMDRYLSLTPSMILQQTSEFPRT